MFRGLPWVFAVFGFFVLEVLCLLVGLAAVGSRAGRAPGAGLLNVIGAALLFAAGCAFLASMGLGPGAFGDARSIEQFLFALLVLVLLPAGQGLLAKKLLPPSRLRRWIAIGVRAMPLVVLAVLATGLGRLPTSRVLGLPVPDLRALGPRSISLVLDVRNHLRTGDYAQCWNLESVVRGDVAGLSVFREVEVGCVDHMIARLEADHALAGDGTDDGHFVEKAISDRATLLMAPLDADLRERLAHAPERPRDARWIVIAEGALATVEVERAVYRSNDKLYVQLRLFDQVGAGLAADLRPTAPYATLHAEVASLAPGEGGRVSPLSRADAEALGELYRQGGIELARPSGGRTLRWFRGLALPDKTDVDRLSGSVVIRGALRVVNAERAEQLVPAPSATLAVPPPKEWRTFEGAGKLVLEVGEGLALGAE